MPEPWRLPAARVGPPPALAPKAEGGRGRDQGEILRCQNSCPVRCAWCRGGCGCSNGAKIRTGRSPTRVLGVAAAPYKRCKRGGAGGWATGWCLPSPSVSLVPVGPRGVSREQRGASDRAPPACTGPPAAQAHAMRQLQRRGRSQRLPKRPRTSKAARRRAQGCG